MPYITLDNEPIPVLLQSMMVGWSDLAQTFGHEHFEVTPLGLKAFDPPGVDDDTWCRSEQDRIWLRGHDARQKALRTITERELRRLDILWDDYIDRETR